MPKILFVHENFPAQFGGVAETLMQHGWDVLFATAAEHIPHDNQVHVQKSGLRVIRYKRARDGAAETHRYLRNSETAVLNSQAFARLAAALEKGGYSPDVVVAHSGWGSGSLAKVVWPQTKYVQYLEWWYRFPSEDRDPSTIHTNPENQMAATLFRNLPFFVDAQSADAILVPTQHQARQLPKLISPMVTVQHDGVDCEFFQPSSGSSHAFTLKGLPNSAPVLTYATRGMEPMRGFPQFMAAASRLQAEYKDLHVLIAGSDRVHYGPKLAAGQSFKAQALAEHTFDKSRLHFLGHLSKPRYRDLLQRSTVHVYLTRPFIASWSLVEAMASGCAIVTSRNDATQEIATDNHHAVMTDLDDIDDLSTCISRLLQDQDRRAKLAKQARERAVSHFSKEICHAALLGLFAGLADQKSDDFSARSAGAA